MHVGTTEVDPPSFLPSFLPLLAAPSSDYEDPQQSSVSLHCSVRRTITSARPVLCCAPAANNGQHLKKKNSARIVQLWRTSLQMFHKIRQAQFDCGGLFNHATHCPHGRVRHLGSQAEHIRGHVMSSHIPHLTSRTSSKSFSINLAVDAVANINFQSPSFFVFSEPEDVTAPHLTGQPYQLSDVMLVSQRAAKAPSAHGG